MAGSDGRGTATRSRRGQETTGEPRGRATSAGQVQIQASSGEPLAPPRAAQSTKGRGTPTYGAEQASETGGPTATARAYGTPEFWVGTRRYGPY